MNIRPERGGFDGRSPGREPIFDLPTALVVMVGVLIAVQVGRGFLSPADDVGVMANFAFVPDRFLGEAAEYVYPGGRGAWAWTFLTYALLHDGWVHLAFNAAMLAALGRMVIARTGLVRLLALLLAATVAGAALHLAVRWGDTTPMIGASGAVAGLFGAVPRLLFAPPHAPLRSVGATLADPRARAFVFALVAMNVVLVVLGTAPFGLGGGEVAWAVHLGGFLVGFLGFAAFDRH
ncbi:rhomboid family intramembrane serine protease [Siculibacillus lacustris]|nr:rhomboid family intramembrane serine protease [Siculibacillus lacustris]